MFIPTASTPSPMRRSCERKDGSHWVDTPSEAIDQGCDEASAPLVDMASNSWLFFAGFAAWRAKLHTVAAILPGVLIYRCIARGLTALGSRDHRPRKKLRTYPKTCPLSPPAQQVLEGRGVGVRGLTSEMLERAKTQ